MIPRTIGVKPHAASAALACLLLAAACRAARWSTSPEACCPSILWAWLEKGTAAMQMLGDDDLDLRGLSDEELERAWFCGSISRSTRTTPIRPTRTACPCA